MRMASKETAALVSTMTEVGTDEFHEQLDVQRMVREGSQKAEKMTVLSVCQCPMMTEIRFRAAVKQPVR